MRVDFYIHARDDLNALHTTACRVVEKAFSQSLRVLVNTESDAVARQLDDRLWTFRDGSFVPHVLLAGTPEAEVAVTPVVIGVGEAADTHTDVLVNLASEVPSFYQRYQRIAELVDADDGRRRAGRARYRVYRENGIEPQTHKL